MSAKEEVIKAIKFLGPGRVPVLFVNKDQERSDILLVNYGKPFGWQQPANASEWGFVWEKLDDTMGQPKNRPIRQWADLDHYHAPDPEAPGRFRDAASLIHSHQDKYIIGSLGISGFNLATFIAGFEQILEGLYTAREQVEKLVQMVFDFEKAIIRQYAGLGVNAIGFYDDWGTQRSLMISPKLWREFFRPKYQEEFDIVHHLGMQVYFHSCGYIWDIIEDLIEIGVDVLNLNQPNVMGIERLGQTFGGRVCFNCPVDIQTTAAQGSREEIYRETQRLIRELGRFNGGFIGYIEEYHSIGMSEDNYRYCIEALIDLGRYK